jgi:integrase
MPSKWRAAVAVLVLLGTAARRFELCAFTCGDFTQGPDGPVAHFDSGKGNKEAEIPISDATWIIIQRWQALKKLFGESTALDAPLLCGRRGEHMARATLNLIWDSALAEAGIEKHPGTGVHVARHAAGMLHLSATGSLSTTAEFMRHASQQITERFYKHVLPSDVRAGQTKAGL